MMLFVLLALPQATWTERVVKIRIHPESLAMMNQSRTRKDLLWDDIARYTMRGPGSKPEYSIQIFDDDEVEGTIESSLAQAERTSDCGESECKQCEAKGAAPGFDFSHPGYTTTFSDGSERFCGFLSTPDVEWLHLAQDKFYGDQRFVTMSKSNFCKQQEYTRLQQDLLYLVDRGSPGAEDAEGLLAEADACDGIENKLTVLKSFMELKSLTVLKSTMESNRYRYTNCESSWKKKIAKYGERADWMLQVSPDKKTFSYFDFRCEDLKYFRLVMNITQEVKRNMSELISAEPLFEEGMCKLRTTIKSTDTAKSKEVLNKLVDAMNAKQYELKGFLSLA